MSLARYRSKRDFSLTVEPRGARQRTAMGSAGTILFVVQKHAAQRLHYDLRLQVDGVLKSWALPKGFPFTRGDKRLAIQVEDHPVEYGDFEGVIPPGNYGAGTVMLWDAGLCQVGDTNPRIAVRQGKVALRLEGQKLMGRWTLVRMVRRADGNDPEWLLIKTGEDADPVSPRQDDRSIVSDRTMKQIAATAKRTWPPPRPHRVVRHAAKRTGRARRHSAPPHA